MKKVYLTIDDSPSTKMHNLIALLLLHEIPAVFFCIGENLKRHPTVIIDAIQQGFLIGNHSWSHPHFSKISLEKAFIEIKRTDEFIEELYVKANVERPVKWFRFPYGDKGDGRKGLIFTPLTSKGKLRGTILQTLLKGLSYNYPYFKGISYAYYHQHLAQDVDWHWTFDVMEWATQLRRPTFGVKNWEAIEQRLNAMSLKDCRGTIHENQTWLASASDEIILLHDHAETAHFLPDILNILLAKKLQFMNFMSLF